MSQENIVIVIPSYNEADRILKVVTDIQRCGYGRIVVIDDGSTDDSISTLDGMNITILRHIVNRGAGAATETGLRFCRKDPNADVIVMIDADTQHEAEDIKHLIEEHQQQNADITIGSRFLQDNKHIPARNWFYNQVANLITTVLAGRTVKDSQSGFKVFSKQALHSIILEQDRYEHCSEIIIKGHEHKLKIIEVPIRVYYTPETIEKGQHFLGGVRTFINLLYTALLKNKRK